MRATSNEQRGILTVAIVRAFASTYQGRPRTTEDADILFDVTVPMVQSDNCLKAVDPSPRAE
ncbi:MAG: hypothetical protein HYY04_14940 [Chloroflexi bacterium]|nr:hypothetical protein [Chloroflexota bacterium]